MADRGQDKGDKAFSSEATPLPSGGDSRCSTRAPTLRALAPFMTAGDICHLINRQANTRERTSYQLAVKAQRHAMKRCTYSYCLALPTWNGHHFFIFYPPAGGSSLMGGMKTNKSLHTPFLEPWRRKINATKHTRKPFLHAKSRHAHGQQRPLPLQHQTSLTGAPAQRKLVHTSLYSSC